ncbi:hypothetical protein ANOM_004390 [Aspergillus nomiae NRRL 13137]|uniref:Thioredoxin domain-containing protein n=1 Tax=Aspergillus nomiae NRRL (strain ATCC 15546 / NRRL 13137 / CBS 260.88 / M93) TaxID=1509407 RepID=A0A0L1J804_ASPN3|nr:uncharacterized protein ANOM_004390 [Aspergillus nomiae NRRL 13137]KNG87533.1 hypothetical protein ANOM_004390 [Aspergillus nomiae NRRL 13137]
MPTNLENSNAFQEALKSQNLVVINCHAVWDGPSSSSPQISDVAAELGVRAMPSFYFFRNGEKVGEVIGANPAAVKAAIDKYRA